MRSNDNLLQIAKSLGVTLCGVLFIVQLAAASTCVTPPGDPVSYWSFDSQSAPGLDNADGNDGELIGAGAEWTQAGYNDGGINLDGNSHFLVADDDSLDDQLSQGFTLAAWIKPADTGNFPVITKANGDLSAGSYEFFVRQGDRLLDCYVAQSGSHYRGRASSIVFPDDGEFHHVACTWDGLFTLDSLHLYIDGVQVDGSTAGRTIGDPDAMRSDGTPVKLGTFNDSSGSANGIIDEASIFDRLLNTGEIVNLMDATPLCVDDSSFFVVPLRNSKAVIFGL